MDTCFSVRVVPVVTLVHWYTGTLVYLPLLLTNDSKDQPVHAAQNQHSPDALANVQTFQYTNVPVIFIEQMNNAGS